MFLNIESREAVANLESMLAIDGVDGIFIGPHDLSVSMDCPEEWDNSEYQETISYILKTARKMGKAAGCHWSFTNGVENQRKWMNKDGANLCIHSAGNAFNVTQISNLSNLFCQYHIEKKISLPYSPVFKQK